MKDRIIRFKNFAILENKKDDWVELPGIDNIDQLVELIKKRAHESFKDFILENELPFKKYEITVQQSRHEYYLDLDSENVISQCGIMQDVFHAMKFSFFSGRKIEHSQNENKKFVFKRYVWCTITINWQKTANGSFNGTDYQYQRKHHVPAIANTNSLYYDIVDGIWLSQSDYYADELGALASKKIYTGNEKHGAFDMDID